MKLVPAGVGGAFTTQRYGSKVLRGWVVALLVATGIAVVVVSIVYGIVKASRAAGAASCRTFASQSGYATNFKIQHFLDSGACYVHLPNGHALPEKMVTGFLPANK